MKGQIKVRFDDLLAARLYEAQLVDTAIRFHAISVLSSDPRITLSLPSFPTTSTYDFVVIGGKVGGVDS
jgi:hypothetical protein